MWTVNTPSSSHSLSHASFDDSIVVKRLNGYGVFVSVFCQTLGATLDKVREVEWVLVHAR